MGTLHRKLHRFVRNPYVQIVVGVLLLAYCLFSIFTEYLGLHHGVFGTLLLQIWNTTPNILQALERIDEGSD